MAARIDRRHLRAGVAEDQRARRDLDRGRRRGYAEANLDIAARLERAVGVGRQQLDEQRPGAGGDRSRRRDDRRREGPAGVIGQGERCREARLEDCGIVLRHVDVDANLADVGDGEQRLGVARAGADEVADVGVARRDDAGERRGDRREALGRQQPVEVGDLRIDQGRLDREVAVLLVRFLPRHRRRLEQLRPAFCRRFRQGLVGAGAGEVGARLDDLLVEFGRIDQAERSACCDVGADILIPCLKIAADARVELGGGERLERARQRQRVARPARRRGDQVDRGDSLGVRPRLCRGELVDSPERAVRDDPGGDDDRDDAGRRQPLRRGRPGGHVRLHRRGLRWAR